MSLMVLVTWPELVTYMGLAAAFGFVLGRLAHEETAAVVGAAPRSVRVARSRRSVRLVLGRPYDWAVDA